MSPVNLVFAGLLRRLLHGDRPSGTDGTELAWDPPASPGPLPRLADPATLSTAERAVLASLGTTVAGETFVPGLYRMLASWPAFLAHVATVLRPHLDDPATRAAGQRLLAAVDAEIPRVFATLPPASRPAMPPAAEFGPVLAALDTYRKTSPEMVVFGRMLGDSLPNR